jgi:hypothetical protein
VRDVSYDERLALLDVDPAAGILAAADLREQRAEAASCGPYVVDPQDHEDDEGEDYYDVDGPDGGWVAHVDTRGTAEHIAAEANPAHALAAVRRWRGAVERHRVLARQQPGVPDWCDWCDAPTVWPCPDLTETADEARAYLGAEVYTREHGED